MKKKIDISFVASSLRGESVFFPTKVSKPAPEQAGEPLDHKREEEPVFQHETTSSTPVRDVPPVLPVPVVRQNYSSPVPRTTVPLRRKIKQRHPFDIYQDQLDTLRQLSAEERMLGGIGSMSAMVREAIDKFLIGKKRKGK